MNVADGDYLNFVSVEVFINVNARHKSTPTVIDGVFMRCMDGVDNEKVVEQVYLIDSYGKLIKRANIPGDIRSISLVASNTIEKHYTLTHENNNAFLTKIGNYTILITVLIVGGAPLEVIKK